MLFNTSRARDFMRRAGLDVLVATSPVNITYFSGYHCWLDPLWKEYMMVPGASSNPTTGYAIFPLEGEPALLVNAALAVNAADLGVRDLHRFGEFLLDEAAPLAGFSDSDRRILELLQAPPRGGSATEVLVRVLKSRGLTGARVGIELEGLSSQARDSIRAGLPGAAVKDCSNLLRLVRMVKTAEELARLKRAAEINEQAAQESLARARPGHPLAEVVEHFRARVAACGADFDHFAYGVGGLGIATERPYVPAAGDVFYVDFGCIYQHYFADSGTTLALGEPPPPLRVKHAALAAGLGAGRQLLRPGIRASAVQAAMAQTLRDHCVTASFPHGHGLGLEVRDYPILVPDNGRRIRDDCIDVPSDLALEANMVINLEAAVFLPGTASLHREQSFLVTADGCQPLVVQEREQPVQGLP